MLSPLFAQEPVSVSWSLFDDLLVTSKTGNVLANPQMVSPFLSGKQYKSNFDNGASTGWQRKGINQIYPATFDPTIYDEYMIKPVAGNSLKVTQIRFSALGGGTGNMRLAVYYSKNDFATFDSLGGSTSMSGGSGAAYNNSSYRATPTQPIVLLNTSTLNLGTIEVVTFPGLNIDIAAGDSLKIRTYPFLSSATTSVRYYPSKEWNVTGTTTPTAFPVTFSSAKAFQKNGGIQVDWTSATESSLSHYAVEKSNDGRIFKEVATVAATGRGTTPQNYNWYDATPSQGTNFYRVKAVNIDGSHKYTGILSVATGRGKAAIMIAPNPVRGNLLNLQMNNLAAGSYTLQLVNSVGQKVYGGTIVHQGGSSSESIALPSLQKGMYTLQIANGATRMNKSVLID